MGNLNYIVFGGVDSRDYGIYISGEGVFNAPERDVEVVNIPGKDGDLLIDRGRFLNIEVTYPGFNFEPDLSTFAERLRAFRAALASQVGYQRLEDSFHPDEFRLASFRSGLDVKPVMYNTASTFDIVFDCKPQRFLKSGEEEITIGEWGETQTASGSIATFEAESNTGIKSLVANIEPIQNLNGYDAPWVGGGGKNKLPCPYYAGASKTIDGATFRVNSDGTITISRNGTGTTSANFELVRTNAPTSLKAGTYIASLEGGTYGNGVQLIFGNGQSGIPYTEIHQSNPLTFTVANDGQTLGYCLVQVLANFSGTVTVKPMIRLASVTDSAYTPYSNICPISGWDSVDIARAGKNLFEVADITADNWNGSVVYTIAHLQLTKETNGVSIITYGDESTQQWVLRKFKLIPNKTYSFRYVSSVGHERIFIRLFDNDGNNISSASIPISGFEYNRWFACYFKNGNQATFTVPSNCSYAWVGFGTTGQAQNTKVYFTNIQLELGSTATTYEPYQGSSYSIPFKDSQDNPITVYGGEIDVVSGVLTAFPYYSSYNGQTLNGEWICDRAVYSQGTTPPTGSQVVDMSGTGTELTLTPTEIKSLLGVNNIWADSGDVSVEYGADPNILVNPTPFEALPLIEVVGVGSLTVGNITMTITGDSTQDIFIDSDIMEAYEDDNGAIISRNDRINLSGMHFPTLGTETGIAYTGLTSVTVTPRWWTI